MRNESELKTRLYLRRRREERRHDRLIKIGCLMGATICMACLVCMEWSALVVAFG